MSVSVRNESLFAPAVEEDNDEDEVEGSSTTSLASTSTRSRALMMREDFGVESWLLER